MANDDEDKLGIDDLIPAAGGEWHGLLFDNPTLRLPPCLTWSLEFPFKDVARGGDASPVSVSVEWLPIPADSWRRVAGHHLSSATFGEPAEATVYYYLHRRFQSVDVRLTDQDNRSLRAVAALSGDIDGLGIDPVRADAWLTFTGITVSLHDVNSPEMALTRLRQFTDTTGLTIGPDSRTAGLRFLATPR
ncbi:hypothetical protein GCM10023322_12990 [Rugosimonospora acidiphila]|uniref:Uncharacterized protein n=1 Tax=Rugosimonospora acidiphila TaxID=556531 RepID=A0ABP9RMM9_9ACTN